MVTVDVLVEEIVSLSKRFAVDEQQVWKRYNTVTSKIKYRDFKEFVAQREYALRCVEKYLLRTSEQTELPL